jgi:hypothetical protein
MYAPGSVSGARGAASSVCVSCAAMRGCGAGVTRGTCGCGRVCGGGDRGAARPGSGPLVTPGRPGAAAGIPPEASGVPSAPGSGRIGVRGRLGCTGMHQTLPDARILPGNVTQVSSREGEPLAAFPGSARPRWSAAGRRGQSWCVPVRRPWREPRKRITPVLPANAATQHRGIPGTNAAAAAQAVSPDSPGVRPLRGRRSRTRKPRLQSPRVPRAARYLASTAAMKPSGSTRLMVSELTFALRNSVLGCRGR